MNIRAKLFLMVFGMIVLFAGASSVYFILLAPVERIEDERTTLGNLGSTMRNMLIELNRLDSAALALQTSKIEAAIGRSAEAFGRVREVHYLRKIDPDLANALEVVERLQVLNEQNMRNVLDIYAELYKDAAAVFIFPETITLRRFYTDGAIAVKRQEAHAVALQHLARFESLSGILNDSLESSINVIEEQDGLIGQRILSIRQRAVLTAALIIAVLIVLIVVISIVAANSIAKNVIIIARGVKSLKDGDLSVTFNLKGRDEVVDLSRGMNDFVHALDESVLGIKDAAARNSQVRDRLEDAVGITVSSLEKLRSAVGGVESQSVRLDERIGETRNSVKSISGGVTALDERISDQISMVEESTAAITQMLATIENMARLAEKDRELADTLVRTSDSGKEVFLAAFEKIEAINERVGKIEEMIEIIDTIAGQTNLLAMNAAIEAAHAGEAGKGFAVVADEIRKLAEASAEGSREIAASVHAIVESIASARTGSVETTSAFGQIEASIRDVSRSVSEISASLGETNEGGRQILTAMTSLRELSASINQESTSVAANTRSIDVSMGELDEVADLVRTAMVSIGERSDEIAATSERTAALAEELSSVGSDLEGRIARFKTTCEADGGTITKGGNCESA